MVRDMERVQKAEHRTRSELVREALRTYFTGGRSYTPTAAELRAIKKGRAAIRSGAGPPEFAQAVRLSLVIAIVAALFISEQYFLPFWLLGALATALAQERAATLE